MISLLWFALGLGCGSLAQGFLWAGKAKGQQRKEWFGKLYRVVRDDDKSGEAGA